MTAYIQQVFPFLNKFIQEGQQFYNANKIFEENKKELEQLITDINHKLTKDIEYYIHQEGIFDDEEKQNIEKCKTRLDKSHKILKEVPSQLNKVRGYIYIKGREYQELLDCLNALNELKSKIDYLARKVVRILRTEIFPRGIYPQTQQNFQISIKLKLQASQEIKSIFDRYPYNLKSEYKFDIFMSDDEFSNKDIYVFKREEFLSLHSIYQELKIDSVSRQNHCSLQLRNLLHLSPQKRVLLNPEMETPTPQENSFIYSQKDQQNLSNKFQLFLIANGPNGMTIIRNRNQTFHIHLGQDFQLQTNDQIVFFFQQNQDPLISFIVQQIQIKEKIIFS